MPVIKLSNRNVFPGIDGNTILESGCAAGVVLEHSCRIGLCGACKTQVISGETVALVPEQSITREELDQGFVLTCCREAKTDLELEAEDLGRLADIKVQTMPCRIDSLTALADDVLEVVLRTPPASRLVFLPGQYVDVIGRAGLRRSYSIANAPREDGKLSLQIRKVEGGEFSRYWFDEAKSNDLLRLEGPLGTFCLRETEASRLILLATGTGIAPVRAILEELQQDSASAGFERITVYWGGRHKQDVYWTPDFPSLPLTFVPVLSRAPDFAGRHGYVQFAALEDSSPLSDAVVYACGSDTMIRDAKIALIDAGLPAKNFYSDAFVQSGLEAR